VFEFDLWGVKNEDNNEHATDFIDQSNRSALNYARILSVLALHFDDSLLIYYSFSIRYFVLLSFLLSSTGGFSAAATRRSEDSSSSIAFLFSLARTVFSTS